MDVVAAGTALAAPITMVAVWYEIRALRHWVQDHLATKKD